MGKMGNSSLTHTHTVVCTVFALKEKSGFILCLPLFAALLQLGIEFQGVRDGGCARECIVFHWSWTCENVTH